MLLLKWPVTPPESAVSGLSVEEMGVNDFEVLFILV
jgi:hypothetical protein